MPGRPCILTTLAIIAMAVAPAIGAQAAPTTADAPRSTPLLTIPDTTVFPEGLARDEARGRWLVSSVRQRRIVAIHDDGRVIPFAPALPADVGALLGLAIDPARGLLYAGSGAVPPMVGFVPADTLRAEVLQFDLASGALLRRIALPAADRQRLPGDLALGPDGTLYVSDGLAGRLYAVPPGGAARVLATAPLLASPQGIAPTPDGRALLVSDYRNGLLHVPLDGRAEITAVADTAGRRIQGVDGLLWDGEELLALHNGRLPGRILRLTLGRDLRSIVRVTPLETVPGVGEPTHGVVHDGALVFIANSPWSAFDERGARKPGTTLAPPELRRLLLPR